MTLGMGDKLAKCLLTRNALSQKPVLDCKQWQQFVKRWDNDVGGQWSFVSDTKNAIDTTMPQTAAMATRSLDPCFGWEPYSLQSSQCFRLFLWRQPLHQPVFRPSNWISLKTRDTTARSSRSSHSVSRLRIPQLDMLSACPWKSMLRTLTCLFEKKYFQVLC